MKAICRIDFVTALLLLIINCMFLFKEYEKQLNLKEPIKVRTKNWLMDANPYIWIFI